MLVNAYRFGSGGDPFFANVALLCGFNGVDGATAIVSEDAAARVGTFVGNAQLDTAQKAFGLSSLLVDGNGDYVSFPDAAVFTLGTQDFTIEAFVRIAANTNSYQGIVAQWSAGTSDRGWGFTHTSTGNLAFYWSTTNADVPGFENAAAMSLNTWYHVAVCRNGANLRFFLDGVQQGLTRNIAANNIRNCAEPVKVGREADPEWFNGWIDEVRVTVGVARYVANFTPPAAPFPRS